MADVTSIVNLMQGIGKDDSTEYLAKLSKTLAYLLNNLDSLNVTSINTSITRVASENGKTIISGALIELSDESGVLRARMGLKTNGTFAFDIYNASGVLTTTLNDTGMVFGAGTSIDWNNVGVPTPEQIGALPDTTFIPTIPGYITSTHIDGTSVSAPAIRGGVISGAAFTNLTGSVSNPTYTYCLELGDINGYQAFSFFSSSNAASNPASNSNNIFSAYDGDFGYMSLAAKLGFTFLTVNSSSFSAGTVLPRGTWDFTNATVTGFTAVWG